MNNVEKKFIHWILKNHQSIGIRIKRLTWTKSWAPGLTEYSAHLNFQGKDLYGWGTDIDTNMALIKAVAELLERCAQVENNIESSNGMSAHLFADKAERAAISELFERDIFINQFLSQGKLTRIEINGIPEGLLNFIKNIEDQKVRVEAYALGEMLGQKCVMTISYDLQDRFGMSIGLGISSDSKLAVKQACTESLRRVVWALEKGEKTKVNLDQFLNLSEFTHSDHRNLAMNKEYTKSILKRIASDQFSNTFPEISPSSKKIKTKFIKLVDSRFSGHPLIFCHASSEELQTLPKGPFTDNNINKERFNLVGLSQKYSISDLLPHPLA